MSASSWRWLALCSLGFAVWMLAFQTHPVQSLSDAELQELWGGSPDMYCGSANTPDCDGISLMCQDFAPGAYDNSPCVAPTTITRYYSPESCGSPIYTTRVCGGTTTLSVACTAAVKCVTRVLNGTRVCSEGSLVTNYITITTDLQTCRNIIPRFIFTEN